MGLFVLIIGIILDVGLLAALGYFLYKFCKELPLGGAKIKVEGSNKKIFLGLVIAQGISTIISSFGFLEVNKWSISGGRVALLIIGSLLFGSGIALFISSFVMFFYRKDMEEKQRNIVQKCLIFSIPTFILGLWLLTDAFATVLPYPLPNAFDFGNGFGYPKVSSGNFSITFYGILIVTGALISYFVGDHLVYKKYGKHGLLDTVFLVAFPLGIIGARLWYCIVLEPADYFIDDFITSIGRIVDIRRGGLAIQGGAILGIISGGLFLHKFRRYMNIRWILDLAVPTILIAQAVGRWGNFFNQEVYGIESNIDAWWFLPQVVKNNMVINGSFRVPLFLIESIINIGGYFIIRYPLGRGLKKYLRQGDQVAMYLIYYGLVRIGLEPLREGFTLNLGSSEAFGYLQSWITAFSMLIIGIGLMVGLRIFEKIRRNKGKEVKEYEAI